MEALANIVHNHGRINLSVNGELQLGYVLYRPYHESEEFLYAQVISGTGQFLNQSSNIRTDFINVEGAVEFVYSGQTSQSGHKEIFAYDAEKNPIGSLLSGNKPKTDYHIVYDGTYKYIVACSLKSVEHSLVVYFRNRRH